MKREHRNIEDLTRQVQLKFRVTEEERDLIREKMQQLGTNNLADYTRKIAIQATGQENPRRICA